MITSGGRRPEQGDAREIHSGMTTDSSQTNQFVARLRGGDRTALGPLFDQHRNRLKRVISFRMDVRLRERLDASDVVQDVFLDANQRLDHFLAKPTYSFFLWLRGLAQQRLIDVHRRHFLARKRAVGQQTVKLPGQSSLANLLLASLTSPSRALEQAELLDRVTAALEAMPEVDREVLMLRHFEELTNNEAAAVLGITKAGASNRYVRALQRLRHALDEPPETST